MGLPEPADGDGPRLLRRLPRARHEITDDPAQLGRVQVRFPSLGTDGDRDVRAWATLCSPYADKDQGLQILPEVDSQVVVAFEAGDFRRGYIVGAAWNGKAAQPEPQRHPNNIRVLRTRADSRLEFDDTVGSPKISLTTKTGHKVVLDEAPQEITITHANGCTITLNASGGIDITANSVVNVTGPVAQRQRADVDLQRHRELPDADRQRRGDRRPCTAREWGTSGERARLRPARSLVRPGQRGPRPALRRSRSGRASRCTTAPTSSSGCSRIRPTASCSATTTCGATRCR